MLLIQLLESLLGKLQAFRGNLQKDNANRRRDPEVTNRKFSELENYNAHLEQLISEYNIKLENKELNENTALIINDLIVQCKNQTEEIKCNLESRSRIVATVSDDVDPIDFGNKNQQLKMAGNFDFKTAASLLHKLDGSNDSVHQLVQGIELYEPSLTAESKPLLINYVLKACLSYRDKIRMKTTYENVAELKNDLKNNFLPKQSAPAIISRLQNLKQNNISIEEYARSIETLMADLTVAQTGNEEANREIFRKQNEKLGVDVFARGIRNLELRTVIKARNYSKLSEAVNAAKDESALDKQNSEAVFAMHGRRSSYANNHLTRSRSTICNNKNYNHNRNYTRQNSFTNNSSKFRNSNYNNTRGNTNYYTKSKNFNSNNRYNNYKNNYNSNDNLRPQNRQRTMYFTSADSTSVGPNVNQQPTFFRGPNE